MRLQHLAGFVKVRGRIENYQNNLQFIIESVGPAKDGSFDIADLVAHTTKNIDEMCGQLGIVREEIGRLCCHPGGVKVIDAIESALRLNQGELNLEREVLRDYGNMSAPTVMFVLDRLLERGLPDKVLMTAFGPGFTCGGLLLEAA